MNGLDKIFSEDSLGLPIKVKMGKGKNGEDVYIYGRYYGHGYDGESSLENEDYHLITLVTAGGSLIRGGFLWFEQIKNKEDLETLERFEKMAEQPYFPYLSVVDNKFCKSYEYKKQPLTYEHYPLRWFEENGYFEIDVDVFGNALSTLFTAYYGERYYYNKIDFSYEGKTRSGLNYNDVIHSRCMFLLSQTKYRNNIKCFFSEYPYRDRDYFDSMFKQKPISINKGEYLINFGHPSNPKIKLGKVEQGEFIPSTYPFNDVSHREQINYNNSNFDIVEDFIIEIMNYKLSNRKANLDQNDMNTILEKYGISYIDEVNKLINVLKNTNEKAMDTLSRNNQIGKVLSKKMGDV